MATTEDGIATLASNVANVHIQDGGSGTGTKEGGRGRGNGGGREKADRATRDQVLDQRTEMILLQMINKGLVSELEGVISTGKEANVYAAVLRPLGDSADEPAPATIFRAAKVYKTSILSFVDRERYIAGEHRFRHGEHKGNNRKMVKKWAEKEFRNLQRLHRAGIPCPFPIQLKVNVLLMSFLGSARGVAYPRLRDVELQPEGDLGVAGGDDEAASASVARQWRALYLQLVSLMRRLYQVCRLVHADLSEYNILYNAGTLYVIDVSQSVGHDHPQTFDFLRMDIRNVGSFFRRKGVDTLRDRSVFDFVTAATGPIEGAELDAALEQLMASEPPIDGSAEGLAALEVDNEVFRSQFIPQSLQQVYDAEMEAGAIRPGGAVDRLAGAGTDEDDNVYKNLLADSGTRRKGGRKTQKADDKDANEDEDEDGGEDRADDSSDSDSSGSGVSLHNSDEEEFGRPQPRGKRFEDKDVKRAHKAAIKEEKRQKRQTKMPKKMKKRLVSSTKKA
ncbi:serine/threonine-protein kinase rio1 [Grosmannia clavigera kw1407]|uniref:Serine/threonine-protein kinase RIO1 n=1 Tax=Grosmannia clavigera (strain kw1407 / UAMH 11150) TaxID=655863 RepID=F0XNJ6_GROCL|nr:serine/threonine-protein kinase rio1 [Grosmannia clavigera kw1407]EFX00431.1 serine/threonine-protein kinase rio1 [Grosmannia clavigera kw1407]